MDDGRKIHEVAAIMLIDLLTDIESYGGDYKKAIANNSKKVTC